MHTKLLILGLSVATLPSVAAANDIVDFLNDWRESQNRYNQRYDRWDEYRNGRPDPRPEVVRPPVPEHRHDNDNVRYEVGLIVNKMQPYVTAINDSVTTVNDRELNRAAEQAENDLRGLVAAINRNDGRDLKEHHEDFDKNWQTTVYTLQNKYKSGPKLNSYISRVNEYDLRLHQLLHVGHRPGFERNRVVRLTEQLDENVEVFEKRLSANVDNWQHQVLAYQSRRVARHADDLAALAKTNVSHQALTEEFRQFDTAWHTLTDRIRAYGTSELNLHREIAQVRNIDRELHEVLLVEAPIVSDSRSFEAVLERAEETADEIGDEIRRTSDYSDRYGQRRLAGNMLRLEEALEDFEEVSDSRRTQEQWNAVQAHWTNAKLIFDEAPHKYTPRAKELMQQLEKDIRFLSSRFGGKPNCDIREVNVYANESIKHSKDGRSMYLSSFLL